MGRILAIDYGQKRVGVAITDTLQLTANGLDTIHSKDLISFLQDLFLREEIKLVVVGYPKQMNNTDSESVVHVKRFLATFRKQFPEKEVYLIDERFTSKMAFQTMIDAGAKKKQRQDKALIDKISATIILQSYLEMRQNLSSS